MSDSTIDFNPYQAPVSQQAETSLAPDTEFLFNNDIVAGVGTIVLPKVCVLTGAPDSLLAKETCLWWCPKWIWLTREAMILPAVVIGFPFLLNRPPSPAGLQGWQNIQTLFPFCLSVGLIVGAFASIAVSLVVRKPVTVIWYLAQQKEKRFRAIGLTNLVLSITAVLTLLPLVSMRSSNFPFTIFVPLLFWMLTTVYFLVRGKRALRVVDHKDGLFYVAGVSEKFLAEVKRMVEQYENRTRS